MKVLVLSPYGRNLITTIAQTGDDAVITSDPVSVDVVKSTGSQKIISYRYHHTITDDLIGAVGGNVFDLHVSFLPWNRGADSHFWSFFDGTPKGVSIYRMRNSRLDGDVLAQRQVSFDRGETLSTTYERLHREVESLFAAVWGDLRAGRLTPISHAMAGSFHHVHDKELFFALLQKGWDTPVDKVEALGRRFRGLSAEPAGSAPDGSLPG